MRILNSALIIYFILSSGLVFADGKEKEPLYSQLNRAIVRLEHINSISQEGSKEVITKNIPDGTAFFVVKDKSLFIVSARHVVEKPYDLHARVQCKNRKTDKTEVLVLSLPRSSWVFHENSGDKDTNYVDVASMKISWIKDRSVKYFRYESDDSAEKDKNQLPSKDPDPPHPILVFGFPANIGFDLTEQKPLGRYGIISMKTEKEFLKLNGRFIEERCCLIDSSIFPGNSGSPVINQPRFGASKAILLGLVIATNNSLDFGIIEPVSRIRELIDLAKMHKASGSWIQKQ